MYLERVNGVTVNFSQMKITVREGLIFRTPGGFLEKCIFAVASADCSTPRYTTVQPFEQFSFTMSMFTCIPISC